MEILLYLVAVPLVFYLLLPFCVTITSVFKKDNQKRIVSEPATFAVIITAYKNLSLVKYCVESILNQDYFDFHIYVVADCCDEKISISHEKLTILEPENALNSKVRSMKYAVDNLKYNHTHVCILDPDNLIKEDFFYQIKFYIECGYGAIQGRRTAKNSDTVFAKLDALGEAYYNYISRFCIFNLGSSSSIAGSGMVISIDLFKKYFETSLIKHNFNKVILGEDKIMQNYLVSEGERIAFVKSAIIFDEKLQDGSQVERQRTRWLNTYFQNLSQASKLLFDSIKKLNWNKFLFSVMSLSPPLFILLLSSLCLLMIAFTINVKVAYLLLISVFVFLSNFFLVWKLANVPPNIVKSFWLIPLFIWKQVKALFSIGKSKDDFLTTTSSKAISIDNVRE